MVMGAAEAEAEGAAVVVVVGLEGASPAVVVDSAGLAESEAPAGTDSTGTEAVSVEAASDVVASVDIIVGVTVTVDSVTVTESVVVDCSAGAETLASDAAESWLAEVEGATTGAEVSTGVD